jgi:citrate synthase
MGDHELAASTLAVRVSASFGADPYAAVVAGLGPVSGARHGAASRRIEQCLAAIRRGERVPHAAARLLGTDESVPGFGHPLYPQGDPRVDMLLPVARSFGPLREAEALRKVAAAQGAAAANVDFALAALTHRLGLGVGAGEAIFTMGRLAGWLAHAIEEYTSRTAFRLRAVYTGPRP